MTEVQKLQHFYRMASTGTEEKKGLADVGTNTNPILTFYLLWSILNPDKFICSLKTTSPSLEELP